MPTRHRTLRPVCEAGFYAMERYQSQCLATFHTWPFQPGQSLALGFEGLGYSGFAKPTMTKQALMGNVHHV